MTKKKARHRTKEQDLAYGIVRTRFFKSYISKFNKAFDRQTIAFELTKDHKVLVDSFFTEDEKKIFEMWKQIQAILNHLNDIYLTIKYIKLNGLKTLLNKNEIPENEYLRFMYENHLIRISSTPDICAMLGDIIFQTGISKRRFNWHKFVNNDKVKNHRSATVILELVGKLDSLSDERDRIIHFGGHKSQIIESIESNTFDKAFLKNSPFLQKHYKTSRIKELRKLTKDMKANFKVCVTYTKLFLNSLTDKILILKV